MYLHVDEFKVNVPLVFRLTRGSRRSHTANHRTRGAHLRVGPAEYKDHCMASFRSSDSGGGVNGSSLESESGARTTSIAGSNLKTCPLCNRGFSKPSHLLRHLKTHDSDRPFTCQNCKKAYTREDSLTRHLRKVHTPNSRERVSSPSVQAQSANVEKYKPYAEIIALVDSASQRLLEENHVVGHQDDQIDWDFQADLPLHSQKTAFVLPPMPQAYSQGTGTVPATFSFDTGSSGSVDTRASLLPTLVAGPSESSRAVQLQTNDDIVRFPYSSIDMLQQPFDASSFSSLSGSGFLDPSNNGQMQSNGQQQGESALFAESGEETGGQSVEASGTLSPMSSFLICLNVPPAQTVSDSDFDYLLGSWSQGLSDTYNEDACLPNAIDQWTFANAISRPASVNDNWRDKLPRSSSALTGPKSGQDIHNGE